MKNKTIIAGVITMALVSFGANAALAATLAKDMGQGVVNFKGTVIDAPCGIAPESADQSIDFGQIPKSHLDLGGTSVKKDLNIKLVNCNFSKPEAKKTVSVTFSGKPVNAHPDELGTTGDTGTAIVVSTTDGSMVKFDGTAGTATKLQAGNNILRYSTWVKKATGGTLKEGDFTAVANFNLTYE